MCLTVAKRGIERISSEIPSIVCGPVIDTIEWAFSEKNDHDIIPYKSLSFKLKDQKFKYLKESVELTIELSPRSGDNSGAT